VTKAIVFEPSAGGHRLGYAKLVLDAISGLCCRRVLCTTRRALDSSEFREVFGSATDIEIDAPIDGPLSSRQAALLLVARESHHRPDLTLLPTADGIAQWLGWLSLARPLSRRPPPRLMLLMRGHNYLQEPRSLRSALKRQFCAIGLSRCNATTLFALGEELRSLLAGLPTGGRVVGIPEAGPSYPTPLRSEARSSFGFSDSDVVVGFFGRRDQRKGFDLLLNALGQSRSPHVHLLALGRQDASTAGEYSKFVASDYWRHRVTSADEFVSDTVLAKGIAAADVVVLPYRKHAGSSGLLVQAAAAGTRVLASDFGWIGAAVRNHRLGRTVDVELSEAFANALEATAADGRLDQSDPAVSDFLTYNSASNVRKLWYNAAERALCGASSPPCGPSLE
jgi:glycosyltransferase involved in cell wall biosynthesis